MIKIKLYEKGSQKEKETTMKKVKDHLGNEFNSIAEMCRHYGINNVTYVDRIKAGMTVEQALTTPVKDKYKKCKDHLGNEYTDVKEMCEHYNIKVDTFYGRVKYGWKLEQILETPVRSKGVIDNGVRFKSKEEFANFHNMSSTRYYRLMSSGHTLEDDKNHKFGVNSCNLVTDPFGRTHRTLTKMLEFYDIPVSSYVGYLVTGRTLNDLMTDRVNGHLQKFSKSMGRYSTVDHLGKTYESFADMCRHYKISVTTVRYRLLCGWSLKDSLTKPTGDVDIEAKSVTDHLGNKYSSVASMCKHYNIGYDALKCRVKAGWTVEQALTTPVRPKKKYNRD